MTSGAGHLCVFAIQFERCFIVVEPTDAPVFEGMAALAIGGAVLFKLPLVCILVAGRALGRQVGKLLEPLGQTFFVAFLAVARSAVLARMRALQFEFRQVVIEAALLPAAGQVALIAGLVGVIFFIDVAQVYVGMTVHAAFADIPELPFRRIFFMTGKTRACCVRAFQRKF